jgi:hypothetical protein
MVTEYIKRGYKKGYDEKGNLVYKVPVDEATPVVEEKKEEVTLLVNEDK